MLWSLNSYTVVGLGAASCRSDSARELLVEEERADFSRERQVLDGSPAGDHTNLGNVEVGVAGIVCRHSLAEVEARTELTLGGQDVESATVVANLSIAAPEAGRPVGIPVVVVRTTDTPCVRQLEVAGKTAGKEPGQENRIRRLAKANALIGTRDGSVPPNIAKLGDAPDVEITAFVIPLA